jgi:hypothetical protein
MGEGTLPVGMLAGRLASGNSSRARSVVVESIERVHNTAYSKVGSRASSWVHNFFQLHIQLRLQLRHQPRLRQLVPIGIQEPCLKSPVITVGN